MAVGLAVEFCVHVAKAFTEQVGTRNERAKAAMVEMGSSVVTGITFTNISLSNDYGNVSWLVSGIHGAEEQVSRRSA